VTLDLNILANLTVKVTPKAYLRMTPMEHASAPLGAGFGTSRFSRPTNGFKVIYLGQDLTTCVAETLVRDRFEGNNRRKLQDLEAAFWGATEVTASTPPTLIDLRTTGSVRLGVSTDAAHGKAQEHGRELSQAIYNQTDADGLIYCSRLTGGTCICVYDRAISSGLSASSVIGVTLLKSFVEALQALNVTLIQTP
jgi:hypothetical protein